MNELIVSPAGMVLRCDRDALCGKPDRELPTEMSHDLFSELFADIDEFTLVVQSPLGTARLCQFVHRVHIDGWFMKGCNVPLPTASVSACVLLSVYCLASNRVLLNIQHECRLKPD